MEIKVYLSKNDIELLDKLCTLYGKIFNDEYYSDEEFEESLELRKQAGSIIFWEYFRVWNNKNTNEVVNKGEV